jgi:hypothetical protein
MTLLEEVNFCQQRMVSGFTLILSPSFASAWLDYYHEYVASTNIWMTRSNFCGTWSSSDASRDMEIEL